MRALDRGRGVIVLGGGLIVGLVAFGVMTQLSDGSTVTSSPEASSPLAAPVEAPASTTTITAQPTTVPTTTAPDVQADQRRSVVVHAVGDVNFDPDYIDAFRIDGPFLAFAKLDGLFLDDDLSIVNLECAPSLLGEPLDKEFVFRCPPASLGVAKSAGIDVVNLANNHSQDYGTTAMLDGLIQARLAGLGAVGVGIDVASATEPYLTDVGGWRIAVLGMGGVKPSETWVATEDRPGMADGDDIELMAEAVRNAAAVADLVFVSIHWGVEGESQPRADDRERAKAMIEAGADAIFGHHPHRLGPLEVIDGVPVFWTLGNFIWPRFSDLSATSGVARLEIDEDGSIVACLLPAFIESAGQPVLVGARTCSESQ